MNSAQQRKRSGGSRTILFAMHSVRSGNEPFSVFQVSFAFCEHSDVKESYFGVHYENR